MQDEHLVLTLTSKEMGWANDEGMPRMKILRKSYG
jgi:hypothetical protein